MKMSTAYLSSSPSWTGDELSEGVPSLMIHTGLKESFLQFDNMPFEQELDREPIPSSTSLEYLPEYVSLLAK
jgi:hypothetical protein